MKLVHIGFNCLQKDVLVQEVADVLYKDDFNVELFGVSLYAEHLPDNYQIVDYGSRETLLVCENGEIIDDPDDIEKWELKQCC